MCPNVSQRKVVNICLDRSVSTNVNIPINVNFTPDEVVVKSVTFNTVTNNAFKDPPDATIVEFYGNEEVYQVATNLIQDQVLCSFLNSPNTTTPNTHFTCKRVINSEYNFQLQALPTKNTGAGALLGTDVGQLIILLDFVQYEKK